MCEGEAEVLVRRGAQRLTPTLLAGPGKVAQALGLDPSLNSHDLLASGGLELRPGHPPNRVLAGPRVGIGFASLEDQTLPWRLADGDSLAVSHRKSLQAPLRNGDRPWPR